MLPEQGTVNFYNTTILGIINCPAHQERWVGVYNKPTTLNGNVVKTSDIQKINMAKENEFSVWHHYTIILNYWGGQKTM